MDKNEIKNVLLINSNTPEAYKEKMGGHYPYGVAFVGDSLIESGFMVKIIDAIVHNYKQDEVVRRIVEGNYDFIGISGFLAASYGYIKKLIAGIKDKVDTPVIVGGIIAAPQIWELLLRKCGADFVCTGAGEETIPDLLKAVELGCGIDNVKGIAYLKDGKVISTPANKKIQSHSLTKIFESVLSPHEYVDDVEEKLFNNHGNFSRIYKQSQKHFSIKSSRGCIAECAFCYRHLKGYNSFPAEDVVKGMKYLYEKYNVRFFSFEDELFYLNKKWLDVYKNELYKEGLLGEILFRITGARVDTVTYEKLKQLKKCGCTRISYGFESGSQKMLDSMGKKVKVSQNIDAALKTKELGINFVVQLVIGMPGETIETIKETKKFIKVVKTPEASINYVMAFPGSPLWKYATRNRIIDECDIEYYLEKIIIDPWKFSVFARYKYCEIPMFRFKLIRKELDFYNGFVNYGVLIFILKRFRRKAKKFLPK